ncbi:pseudaminic acid biosynthesis N-acetyl transferase [Acetonema longum DSM 6540]|uniref:Pseudaminic acid biosynthesis N-acetyl transferase n=2 Tax=Acetonema TaxID=2373 RepID=F7NNV6_9FIRM|nr:pseudaminic acid biosynthesis N-acetyl transferase [Acetonema longum DSM 6540]
MSPTDLDQVLAWRNSPRIRAAMFSDHIITIEEHRAWFQKVQNSEGSKLLIFLLEDIAVGVVNITDIDFRHNHCFWGFYIGIEPAPSGTGLAMGYFALNYAFGELGIRKLCSEVIVSNTTSLRYHHRLGFYEEGQFREHVKKDGIYADVIRLACFRSDWEKVKRDIAQRCFGGE